MPYETVCRTYGVVTIGVLAARKERFLFPLIDDYPLQLWEGCRQLDFGEYFVVGTHPRSFDSRYFGPIAETSIIGRAHALWVRSVE
jgi:type IV secretory pathway protease TraF